MADRSWLPYAGTLEVDVVELFCDITIGATGAVSSASGKGITSVARSSAGQYLVTLSDRYNKLMWAHAALLDTADSDPSTVGVFTRIKSESVNSTAHTVTFQCFTGDDGAAADPASGAVLKLCIKLRNSSVS